MSRSNILLCGNIKTRFCFRYQFRQSTGRCCHQRAFTCLRLLQIPQMESYQAIDLMTGAKEEICLLPYKPTDVSVGGYNGKILKITF